MILRYSLKAGEVVRTLPPEIRQGIRSMLDGLNQDPYRGKPLQRELTGFYSLRYKRHRIIYKPVPDKMEIQIYSIGPRREVYEEFAKSLVPRH